jgi:hypothetical protein
MPELALNKIAGCNDSFKQVLKQPLSSFKTAEM